MEQTINLLKALPSLLWVILTLWLVVYFRKKLAELIEIASWRIKAGATIKVAAFELGAIQVSPLTKRAANQNATRKDDGEFHLSRQSARDVKLFLVHKIAPSADPDQTYDVVIYLVPGLKFGSLLNVNSVEYYFGKHWDSNVFTSIDRATAFSISTSAFAPFTCTARIHFNDGTTAFVHRYIDFEMGGMGATPRATPH